jgi:hypothetical protein
MSAPAAAMAVALKIDAVTDAARPLIATTPGAEG